MISQFPRRVNCSLKRKHHRYSSSRWNAFRCRMRASTLITASLRRLCPLAFHLISHLGGRLARGDSKASPSAAAGLGPHEEDLWRSPDYSDRRYRQPTHGTQTAARDDGEARTAPGGIDPPSEALPKERRGLEGGQGGQGGTEPPPESESDRAVFDCSYLYACSLSA